MLQLFGFFYLSSKFVQCIQRETTFIGDTDFIRNDELDRRYGRSTKLPRGSAVKTDKKNKQ